jgi:hypothetical protein
MTFTVEDRLAIHELIALYGHIIDERELARTPELFTGDAVYDVSRSGGELTIGAEAIERAWSTTDRHPLAHHATNVVVTPRSPDLADYVFKGMGVGFRKRVGSLVYRGHCIRTPQGWRFAEMVVTVREPPPRPEETQAVTAASAEG